MLKTTICPKCQKPYDESLGECPVCARKAREAGEALPSDAKKITYARTSAKAKPALTEERMKIVLLVAGIVLVLALMIGMVFSMGGKQNHAPVDTSVSASKEEEEDTQDVQQDHNEQTDDQTQSADQGTSQEPDAADPPQDSQEPADTTPEETPSDDVDDTTTPEDSESGSGSSNQTGNDTAEPENPDNAGNTGDTPAETENEVLTETRVSMKI